MPIKYIKTRGAIALVDDHDLFLEAVKLAFPADRVVYTFSNPADAIEPLARSNECLLREEARLSAILAMEEPAAALRAALEWIRDDSRRKNIESAFVDYNMPGINGLELLRHITRPRMMRVLLTGQGTSEEAVEAFNAGLIDVYVPKKEGLGAELRALAERGATRHRNLLWHRLDPKVDQVINDPSGWKAITDIMNAHQVCEYLLVPTPCGYVCRSLDGRIGWLQVDTAEALHGCMEVLQDQGWTGRSLEKLRSQQWTAPIELIDSQHFSARAEEPLAPVTVLSGDPWIGAAYFSV